MTNKVQHRSHRNLISRMCLRAGTAVLAFAGVMVPGMMATPSAQAQTFTVLHSFDGTDGSQVFTGLVQATDGNLYGTAAGGGANGGGTVFKITPSGTLTTLYSFCSQTNCTDGYFPAAGLVQATDGNFYGTTGYGGAIGSGTVFKITPSGTLTTLYSFCSQVGCTDGENPAGALVQATDGNFYGTTPFGGASTDCCGTVFKITPSGTLTTLYSFCLTCTDGAEPNGGLVQATNGNLYGTTPYGGAHGAAGTVFKITTSGTLTTLYSFCSRSGCADGQYPYAALVQATDGSFYGTTYSGGASNDGTVFKTTPSGTLTTLYNFCSRSGCADGQYPYAALVQATDGSFYGTTYSGGASNDGTVFKTTPSGTLTTLYNFCSQSGCTDGAQPYAGLVLDTNGKFYGTTYSGGASNDGTVFGLSLGLGPFVETEPTSGKVGAAVKILGTNLTGATSVTFNGTPATFKVRSSSEIRTVVPEGATSGKVEVTTPFGTLRSNLPFRVRP